MPRQRLTIGTFGDISTHLSPSGRYLARTRHRDWDGHARLVQASGTTAKAAERALKSKLADRDLLQPADTTLTPDSLFRDLVTYWLEDIDTEGRISRTTRNLYERNMRTLVSAVVAPTVLVTPKAIVRDHAVVVGSVRLFGEAIIEGRAIVLGMCTLRDHARVGGDAILRDYVSLADVAQADGIVRLSESVKLHHFAHVRFGVIDGGLTIT